MTSPSEGGCWYCEKTNPPMSFSWGFDTALHLGCLKKHLQESPLDLEALLIAREFCSLIGLTWDEVECRIRVTMKDTYANEGTVATVVKRDRTIARDKGFEKTIIDMKFTPATAAQAESFGIYPAGDKVDLQLRIHDANGKFIAGRVANQQSVPTRQTGPAITLPIKARPSGDSVTGTLGSPQLVRG